MDLKEIYKETENINEAANNCFMSHQLFAAREIIAQKLDRDSIVKNKFKEKIQEIYETEDNKTQHEAYIDLELTPIYNGDDEEKKESKARVFVRIDKVEPILSKDMPSYALHITIEFSGTDAKPLYDNEGYIDKKGNRFVVSHELGHSVLHLDSLIEKTVGSNKSAVSNSNNNKHEEEANVFADVLSDLRDAHLLGKGYELNVKKIRKHKLNTDELEKIIKEAKGVNRRTTGLTMSHVTFAVSDIINKNLIKEKSKETINIYQTAKNNELVEDKVIINCYKRRHRENFYIFELRLDNQNDTTPKSSSMEIEVCKAIGCIYFYFPKIKEIIDKEDEKNASTLTPKSVYKILCDIGMDNEINSIETFAKDINKKRKESLKAKTKDMRENNKLRSRLKK